METGRVRRSAFYEGCINHSAQRIEQIRAHKCIPRMIDRCFTGILRDFRDLFDFGQHHLSTPKAHGSAASIVTVIETALISAL
jgi:hypothetical protein